MFSKLIYVTFWSLIEAILIGFALSLLMGLAALLVAYKKKEASVWRASFKATTYYFLLGIPVTLLAYVTGYLTSISRAAAVGTVLPAVLTFIGGANIYVFGSDSRYKIVVGFCVALFSVALFYGVQRGAFERELGREARLMELSEQEAKVRNYREFRGLSPETFPAWIIGGEPK
jgi:hypothetical protein